MPRSECIEFELRAVISSKKRPQSQHLGTEFLAFDCQLAIDFFGMFQQGT
jgi:hypothetical protein